MSAVELPVQTSNSPVLRTLVLCDLVDSTHVVEQLGDQRAADLMRRHDRLWRDLLNHHGGQEIDRTDGFLAMFERPIHAVAFALAYQRDLRRVGEIQKVDLRARIGIHLGDVVVWQNSPADVIHGAKAVEIEGLVKPVTARLATLALPGQILVSGLVAPLAQRAHGELDGAAAHTRWLNHGRYRFKGVTEAIAVHEVGERGIAPLRAPPWSGKAHREVPWWRRPATVAIEIGALVVVLVVAGWSLFRPPAAIAFAERDWVVIGDLQNITGQSNFDASLRTAMRIGLEQSRFVNVVPELQTRDALTRMQRDPAKTLIDRTIGTEIALREGARALILPSVVEVNGKVRVTAEVIDPKTQATVYSESSDGNGAESALVSIDTLNSRLRSRLGETLASISANAVPLPKATTASLDALKAYALGLSAQAAGHFADALALYEQALKLDPGFALARIGMARIYYASSGEVAAFREQIKLAAALRERMPPRDGLVFDAFAAAVDDPLKMLEKWKLVATLYPDYAPGHYNYALYSMLIANRYDDALEHAQHATSEHNPLRASAFYLVGHLNLALDRHELALKAFQAANDLGVGGTRTAEVDAHSVMRQYAEASAVLARTGKTGMAGPDSEYNLNRITIPLDQGQWQAALAAAENALGENAGSRRRIYQDIVLGLQSQIATPSDYSAKLKTAYNDAFAQIGKPADLEPEQAIFDALFVGYLAARGGMIDLANSALTQVSPSAQANPYPVVHSMLGLLRAEIARASGKPERAVQLLESLRDGNELYQIHVALMNAYAAAGNPNGALEQAQWLTSHRGRAFAEWNEQQKLQALNVADANLAELRAAEIALSQSNREAAREHLARFLKQWPTAAETSLLRARIDPLKTALQPASKE
ncbi:MAG: putative peptide modification system cyclase [Tahibacter sp.]